MSKTRNKQKIAENPPEGRRFLMVDEQKRISALYPKETRTVNDPVKFPMLWLWLGGDQGWYKEPVNYGTDPTCTYCVPLGFEKTLAEEEKKYANTSR